MAAVNSIKLDTRELDRLTAQLEPKAEEIVSSTAYQIEGDSKAILGPQIKEPTGHLESTIQALRVGRLHWRVNVSAEYGIYMELGTGRRGAASNIQRPEGIAYAAYWPGMAARPYLIPAVEKNRAKFIKKWDGLFK